MPTRRALLWSLPTFAVSTAGCTGGSPTGTETSSETQTRIPEQDSTPTETKAPTDSPSPPSPTPTSVDSSTYTGGRLRTLSKACGEVRNQGAISADHETVQLSGTISGPDGCVAPLIQGVDVTTDLTTVTIGLETDSREGCKTCVTEIEYVAKLRFEPHVPEEIRLVHDGVGGETVIRTETVPRDT